MPLESWFPTLIFYEDLSLPPDVKAAAIAAVNEHAAPMLADPEVSGVTAVNSANDLHLDARIARLFGLFGPPLRRFLFDALHIDPESAEFHVGRCWPVVQLGDRAAGGPHTHGGAVFSGVFYLQVPEGAGALLFSKPGRTAYDELRKTEHDSLNFVSAEYAAVEDRLIVFSSDLEHRRLSNQPSFSGARLAIAFDVYSMVSLDVAAGGIPHYENLRRVL